MSLQALRRYVPGLAWMRHYRRSWLRHDVVAGAVLTALLVPQGMAYAELAGLPPVVGLYATMVPLVAYAVFGPSRILVLGPDSAVAPVVAAAVIPLAGDDMSERIALASFLALLVGALCILGGVARLGFLTELLSKPVRVGYLAGIAAVVVVDQVPKMLGVELDADGFLEELQALVRAVPDADPTTLALGAGSLAVILACRRFAPRVPGVLLAVVLGIGAVSLAGLADDVSTVGAVPAGLPHLGFPTPAAGDLGQLLLAAFAIALVAFADTGVLSRSYATKLGERVDQDQELLALGAGNLATGFLQGFPISSSSSRTPVAEAAGARTQLTGVVAACGVGLTLVFATGLFRNLPTATLAAVVVASVAGLVDVPALRRLFRVHRTDFVLALVAAGGVALVGVVPGIGIAVGLSVVTLLWRVWHPYAAVLGRVDALKGYHDLERHPEGRQIPGLVLFRFDAQLFFANAETFRESLLAAVAAANPPARRVVVAAEPITGVDSTAAEMVGEVDEQLRRMGVELAFAELKGPVKDSLVRYGLFDRIGAERFHPTVGTAVHAYLDEHGVPWTDWEEADRGEGAGPVR